MSYLFDGVANSYSAPQQISINKSCIDIVLLDEYCISIERTETLRHFCTRCTKEKESHLMETNYGEMKKDETPWVVTLFRGRYNLNFEILLLDRHLSKRLVLKSSRLMLLTLYFVIFPEKKDASSGLVRELTKRWHTLWTGLYTIYQASSTCMSISF